MDRPSVFDLELADLAQDMILRQRRAAGDATPFSEHDYDVLLQRVRDKARKPRSSNGQDTGFSTRQ
jgi:hypothetical protein